MRLGHADRRPAEAGRLEPLRLGAGGRSELDAGGTVGLRRDRGDLPFDRSVEVVEEAACGNDRRSRRDDGFGQLDRALAPALETVVHGNALNGKLGREAAGGLDLGSGVLREAVDRDDARQAESLNDPEGRAEIGEAELELGEPAVDVAAVVLQCLDGCDEDDHARAETAEAADDVDELLEAHVGAEAALGHDPVTELEAEPVGDERVVAVGDVGERARNGGAPADPRASGRGSASAPA